MDLKEQENQPEQRPEGRSITMSHAYQRRLPLIPSEIRFGLQQMGSDACISTEPETKLTAEQKARSFGVDLCRLEAQPIAESFVLGHCTISIGTNEMPKALRRVSEFIKRCSLAFKVFAEDGRIDIRAPCLLTWCIYFWKQEGDDDRIIVELQRRQGCSVMMQRYRKAFTNYVQFGIDFDVDAVTRCCRQFLPNVGNEANVSTDTMKLEPLNRCREMLDSKSYEQNRFGLENLLLVLDSPCVSQEKLKMVSGAILRGQNTSTRPSLLNELALHLVSNQRRKCACPGCKRDDTCDFEGAEFAEGHKCGIMQNLALKVLASSLSVEVKTGGPASDLILSTVQWRSIICALCYNVSNALSRPQEAAISARCLCLLNTLTPGNGALLTALEHSTRILPSLFVARKFGTAHNAMLERDSRILLQSIEEAI